MREARQRAGGRRGGSGDLRRRRARRAWRPTTTSRATANAGQACRLAPTGRGHAELAVSASSRTRLGEPLRSGGARRACLAGRAAPRRRTGQPLPADPETTRPRAAGEPTRRPPRRRPDERRQVDADQAWLGENGLVVLDQTGTKRDAIVVSLRARRHAIRLSTRRAAPARPRCSRRSEIPVVQTRQAIAEATVPPSARATRASRPGRAHGATSWKRPRRRRRRQQVGRRRHLRQGNSEALDRAASAIIEVAPVLPFSAKKRQGFGPVGIRSPRRTRGTSKMPTRCDPLASEAVRIGTKAPERSAEAALRASGRHEATVIVIHGNSLEHVRTLQALPRGRFRATSSCRHELRSSALVEGIHSWRRTVEGLRRIARNPCVRFLAPEHIGA